jgi:integrase
MPRYKKQKDGRYRSRVTVGHGANGKPIIKCASGTTIHELEENIEQLKAYYMGVPASERRDVMLQEYGDKWYDAYKAPHLRPSTAGMYRYILDAHIYPALGDRQMRAVTPVEIQAILNRYTGRSVSLIGKVILTLRQLFARAEFDGLVDRNPMRGVVTPKGTQGKKRALTESEKQAILTVGESHKDGLLLILLYYTGMRRAEAVGLQWGDIDFTSNRITVRRQVVYVSGIAHEQPYTKTKAGMREIPLLSPLRDALWTRRGLPRVYVLPAPDSGGYLPSATFKRRWAKLMKAAGTPDVTPHMMRHSFATVLYEADVDVLEAKRILGHEDYKTTADIYTHLSQKHQEKTAVKLEIAVGGKNNVAKMLPK